MYLDKTAVHISSYRYLSILDIMIRVCNSLYLVKLYTCAVISFQGVLYLLIGKLLGLE